MLLVPTRHASETINTTHVLVYFLTHLGGRHHSRQWDKYEKLLTLGTSSMWEWLWTHCWYSVLA